MRALRVRVICTDYQGRWPNSARSFVRRWIWDWQTARPYFIWVGYGIILELAAMLGWWLGSLWPPLASEIVARSSGGYLVMWFSVSGG